jgi:glycosyl transferase family 25
MSNLIDKVIYINLDKDVEKRNLIENQLKYFNLNFERFPGVNVPEAGFIGCARAHLEVLKLARERKYKNVLIVEDDLVFIVSKAEFENSISKLFNDVPDFDVCMLSYNLQKGEIDKEHPFLLKNIEAQTASAYLVNETVYDELINLYEGSCVLLEKTHKHWIYQNDMIWKPLQLTKKWYCFSGQLGRQSDIKPW